MLMNLQVVLCMEEDTTMDYTKQLKLSLAASILDMKFKDVLIACMGGVLLAGIIMGLASAGVLGAASSLFAV